jgi:hypothetical protein
MRPTRPTSTPATTPSVGRRPPGRNQSTTTTQSGTQATRRAAIPEATNCSAHTTPPFPPRSRRAPMTAASRHMRPVGRGAPRASAHAAIPAPERRKRVLAIRKGGIVSTAKRMARYVEPQMR